MQKIKLLSAMPKGIDTPVSQPRGLRLAAWNSMKGKYRYEVWAAKAAGPFFLWEQKVERCHFRGGPGRPRWRRLSTHPTVGEALAAADAKMKDCLWGGRPRRFWMEYLYEGERKEE